VALAARSARLNGLDSVTFEKGDAFRVLRQHAQSGETFGMVILDPPKFSPTRQDRDKALRAYHDVNLQALKLIAPEGILVTCACSASMQDFALEEVVAGAATDAKREVQLLERRGQGQDHPVPPYFPEGRYLTCLVFRVF
jgi:23S rRNA (cytosine1962-C5)-methyltransferase